MATNNTNNTPATPCNSPYGCDPHVTPAVPANLVGYEAVFVPGYGWTMQETTSEEMTQFTQWLTTLPRQGVSITMNGPFPVQGMSYAEYEARITNYLEGHYHTGYAVIPQHDQVVITPVDRAGKDDITPEEPLQ